MVADECDLMLGMDAGLTRRGGSGIYTDGQRVPRRVESSDEGGREWAQAGRRAGVGQTAGAERYVERAGETQNKAGGIIQSAIVMGRRREMAMGWRAGGMRQLRICRTDLGESSMIARGDDGGCTLLTRPC